jgi:hypothetical protein
MKIGRTTPVPAYSLGRTLRAALHGSEGICLTVNATTPANNKQLESHTVEVAGLPRYNLID